MYNNDFLDSLVDRMRAVGQQLIPYNYPLADPRLEDFIFKSKLKEICLDGYDIVIHYHKADHEGSFLEVLQVTSENCPFLPFNLVVKLARRFLGGHNLSLVEDFKDGRKIYCWTVAVNKKGQPLSSRHKKAPILEFNGLEYRYVLPTEVKIF